MSLDQDVMAPERAKKEGDVEAAAELAEEGRRIMSDGTVDNTLLSALAAEAAAVEPKAKITGTAHTARRDTGRSGESGDSEIEKLIAAAGLRVRSRRRDERGLFVLQLEECVFNTEHTGGSAAVLVLPSGARVYRCLHNGCADKKWRDFREKLGLAPTPTPGADDTEEGWQEPVPLDQRCEVPPFPVEVLPPALRSFVEGVSENTQTPLDLPGLLSLIAVAVAVGWKCVVRGRWEEPLSLFGAVIAPPGERKSPAFRAVLAPIKNYETLAREAAKPVIEKAQALHRALEKRRDNLEKAFAKAKPEARADAQRRLEDAVLELAQCKVPEAPRTIVDDATPEVLVRLLAQHRSIAILSSEGGVFNQLRGRYSGQLPNLDAYNKAYDGDSIRSDRIGRGEDVADSPTLSIGLTVQPDLVRSLGEEPLLRGLGFVGRMTFAYPRSWVGRRRVDTPAIPKDVTLAYHNAINTLFAMKVPKDEAVVLGLSPEAGQVFDDYRAEIERELNAEGSLGDMADWGNKLAGKTLRLAGLLHVAEHGRREWPWPTTVERASVEKAIALARYMVPHARVALQLMGGDQAVDDAKFVVERLKKDYVSTMLRSYLYDLSSARFKNSDDVDATLDLLVERRYLRPDPTTAIPGRLGRPPMSFEVNPLIAPTPRPEVSA